MTTYAFQRYDSETMARAALRDANASFKSSVMVAQAIRGKTTEQAIALLERVMKKETPIKFTKYANGTGHKAGMAAGKYPVKTAETFRTLVQQGVANAESKGLGSPLQIVHVLANEAARPVKYGRQRGRQSKRVHVELVIAEMEESKKRPKKEARKSKGKKEVVKKEAAPQPATATKATPTVEGKVEKPVANPKPTPTQEKTSESVKADGN